MLLLLCAALIAGTFGSEAGISFGDGAVSQVLRHAASSFLSQQREIDLELSSSEVPASWTRNIGELNVFSSLAYRNVSVEFGTDNFRLVIDRLSVKSDTHFSDIFWPLGFADQSVVSHLKLPRGEFLVLVGSNSLSIKECRAFEASLTASVPEHWLADKVASIFAQIMSSAIESTICSVLEQNLQKVHHSQIVRFPVHEMLPEKARGFLAARNTTLFYRLRKISLENGQITAQARLEWNEINNEDPITNLLDSEGNASFVEMELMDRDRVTVWVQDSLINNLLEQISWQFEWMNEQIPVSSPVIPPDSREFLSTLCTKCYFQVNVAARGQPTLTATNNSLVLEKRDRVHLQVVNPDRNVTSVFVSFILTIQAELRPSFDDGTLRTLVQLLDTNIEMENGAFPKNWGLFMQDLMKGMIMDMLWPELKSAIEELSYGKGVRLSRTCGLDPQMLSITIDEGSLAISSRLTLDDLDLERCVRDLSASLPSTSRIFGHTRR